MQRPNSKSIAALLSCIEEGMRPLLTFERLAELRDETAERRESTFYAEVDLETMGRVLRTMGLRPGDRLLDVGCGGGRWMAACDHMGGIGHGVECLQERAEVAIRLFGEGRARRGTGDDASVWEWASPRLVILSDRTYTELDRIEERIAGCDSVECVARMSTRPLEGFERDAEAVRGYHFDPCGEEEETEADLETPAVRKGKRSEMRLTYYVWRRRKRRTGGAR